MERDQDDLQGQGTGRQVLRKYGQPDRTASDVQGNDRPQRVTHPEWVPWDPWNQPNNYYENGWQWVEVCENMVLDLDFDALANNRWQIQALAFQDATGSLVYLLVEDVGQAVDRLPVGEIL